MTSHADTKIDCSKVYVKKSTFSNEETGDFDGAFAAVAIKEGELVEKGLMRRLPEGFDGNTCPYIFTWGEERPCKTWGMGSGCAPFYNTAKEGTANTRMVRFFDEDRFEIYATRDIPADEELLHTYISLKWRKCFSDLNDIVNKDDK
eukprot:CAMPEP_0197433828 /NCGR_PEP_ID=MMETSP1175-20131217/1639_1 /TAXON_ID=1003142 /ORGANISM="Triceratium dubium, Strain CCMP147" /LENGTH=146 /DNA_ID=CAMNT_0042962331 /DNA_START=150 /DNA_END=590 /DNA_ORIENTATION=+